jgi:hypothetical protein
MKPMNLNSPLSMVICVKGRVAMTEDGLNL